MLGMEKWKPAIVKMRFVWTHTKRRPGLMGVLTIISDGGVGVGVTVGVGVAVGVTVGVGVAVG